MTGNSVFDEWDANLIIWMTPAASPEEIELVARQLDEVEQFAPYTYVDADATYAEFRRYYADQPEVIELVEKEQLPTSFRVRTSMVAEVQGLVEGNNAVSGIEVAG